MKQQKISTRYIVGLWLIAVLTVSIVQPRLSAQAASKGPEAVIAWNARTLRALISVTRDTFRQICITLWIKSKVNTGLINRILGRAHVNRLMRLPQLPPAMCRFITLRHSSLRWRPTVQHFETLYQMGLQKQPESRQALKQQ